LSRYKSKRERELNRLLSDPSADIRLRAIEQLGRLEARREKAARKAEKLAALEPDPVEVEEHAAAMAASRAFDEAYHEWARTNVAQWDYDYCKRAARFDKPGCPCPTCSLVRDVDSGKKKIGTFGAKLNALLAAVPLEWL
jgi:hypothetical protein